MNLIANTTDQKFLEAILTEQQKTNELLAKLLESQRPIARDVEPKEVKKVKKSKAKVTTQKDKPKRGKNDANNK